MKSFIVKDRYGEPAYKIASRGKGETLCFELFVYKAEHTVKGKKVDSGWKTTGKYPTSISHGLSLIASMIEKDDEHEFVVGPDRKSLNEAAKKFKEYLDSFGKDW